MRPDKNLFIVTSALEPTIGAISKAYRFEQTMATLKNLREKVPNAFVLFSDGSPDACDENNTNQITNFIDGSVYWSHDEQIRELSKTGRKSEAEIVLLLRTLFLLKQHPELSKLMYSVKRIFKYSARSLLQKKFNISIYDNADLFGKYVFKQRIKTWMPDKSLVDHLFITRFFSLCPSLIDDYIRTLNKALNSCATYGIDTEHAHFKQTNKKYVVELQRVHVEGIMAGTGKTEEY